MGLCHVTVSTIFSIRKSANFFSSADCRLHIEKRLRQFWLAHFVFVIHCFFIAAGVSTRQTLNEIWALWIRDAAHQRHVSRILSNICTFFEFLTCVTSSWLVFPVWNLCVWEKGFRCCDHQNNRGEDTVSVAQLSAGCECQLVWLGLHFLFLLFVCDFSSLTRQKRQAG